MSALRSTVPMTCAALLLLAPHVGVEIRQVSGRSMEPTLAPGDLVVVNHVAFGLRVAGDYVVQWSWPQDDQLVAMQTGTQLTVKRIAQNFRPSGRHGVAMVVGDNRANSLDSRALGPVSVDDILGVVLPLRFHE